MRHDHDRNAGHTDIFVVLPRHTVKTVDSCVFLLYGADFTRLSWLRPAACRAAPML